jgi:4-hydroxy-3-methylbut-2-en-1-yl diphosphate reductase
LNVRIAQNYGFCFGVKRAIKMAENSPNSVTLGPLIHNPLEIDRLQSEFGVGVCEELDDLPNNKTVVVRTHGIPKGDLQALQDQNFSIVDATCPFVTKPQQICEQMSKEGYDIVIFGDINHPEVKGVMSYGVTNTFVVLTPEELDGKTLGDKVAVVSQTTKQERDFLNIVNHLVLGKREVRVFNTICNATWDNQSAAKELSKEVDIMLIIGGKNSSNTKQLFEICKESCRDSYLIESEKDLVDEWFASKTVCGVTAGASTPDWIIQKVVDKVSENY